MDYAYIKQRITDLRIEKGVSEYQMSLDLGHSRKVSSSINASCVFGKKYCLSSVFLIVFFDLYDTLRVLPVMVCPKYSFRESMS